MGHYFKVCYIFWRVGQEGSCKIKQVYAAIIEVWLFRNHANNSPNSLYIFKAPPMFSHCHEKAFDMWENVVECSFAWKRVQDINSPR